MEIQDALHSSDIGTWKALGKFSLAAAVWVDIDVSQAFSRHAHLGTRWFMIKTCVLRDENALSLTTSTSASSHGRLLSYFGQLDDSPSDVNQLVVSEFSISLLLFIRARGFSLSAWLVTSFEDVTSERKLGVSPKRGFSGFRSERFSKRCPWNSNYRNWHSNGCEQSRYPFEAVSR